MVVKSLYLELVHWWVNIVRHNNHYDLNASLPTRTCLPFVSVGNPHKMLQLCLYTCPQKTSAYVPPSTLMHSNVLLINHKREGLGGKNQFRFAFHEQKTHHSNHSCQFIYHCSHLSLKGQHVYLFHIVRNKKGSTWE